LSCCLGDHEPPCFQVKWPSYYTPSFAIFLRGTTLSSPRHILDSLLSCNQFTTWNHGFPTTVWYFDLCLWFCGLWFVVRRPVIGSLVGPPPHPSTWRRGHFPHDHSASVGPCPLPTLLGPGYSTVSMGQHGAAVKGPPAGRIHCIPSTGPTTRLPRV